MDHGNAALDTGRAARLDPAFLPVRFAAPDAAADGGERRITLDREEVVMARRVGRTAMRLRVPMDSFRGVAVKLIAGLTEGEDRIAIILAHRDRALDVTLYEAEDDTDVVAEWRRWGATLGLPLLVEDFEGRLTEPYDQMGAVEIGRPRPRRRRSFLARRPRFLTRRKAGRPAEEPAVHGEYEMFARD